MTLHAYTDGAARGNPGEGGIGVIIRDESGNVLYSHGEFIGVTTNNVAEYRALIHCLDKATGMTCDRLVVNSDSELVVRQVLGKYKVKDKKLALLHLEVNKILKSAPWQFQIVHVAREMNVEADLLANAGIDNRSPGRP